MKKTFKIIALSVIASLPTLSCSDFLDIVPDNVPTVEIGFENRSTARNFLATAYSYLPFVASSGANPAVFGGDELWLNPGVLQDLSGTFPGIDIALGQQSVSNTRLSLIDGPFSLFVGLRDCNLFIDNINKTFDVTEAEKRRWAAEVKTLKAYYHFLLFRMYGPMPIIRENLPVGVDSDQIAIEREPVDDMVEYIVDLIDEALPELRESNSGLEEERGRITKPIAAAIKAKILVTAASPLFNGNIDYAGFVDSQGREFINSTFDAAKWDRAAEACKEAVAMAEADNNLLYVYPTSIVNQKNISDFTVQELSIRGALTEPFDNFEMIWPATGRNFGSFEQSSAMAKMEDLTGNITAFAFGAIQSYKSPTLRIAEMFYSENGVPIDEDVNYDYADRFSLQTSGLESARVIRFGSQTAKLHFNREPRFYASLGFDNSIWYGHSIFSDDEGLNFVSELKGGQTGGIQLSSINYSATGYLAKKLVHFESRGISSEGSPRFQATSYPWPLMRLADLYLLTAEALNESKAAPDGEIYDLVDRVRQRAGLDGVVSSWASHSSNPSKPLEKDGMRDIIHQERMIELVFEGHRFWDLRRWKRAEEFMNGKFIRGWNITSGTDEGFYTVQNLFPQTFSERDYLWPIGLNNILNNPNLVQNPKW
ncbi:RagB/SusD family nutrient uptake outer membrane protein [Maribacter sp. 2304DJ31-5]|uniref:RagB/SusD family nutrient uptake outer membrane protein n=1 Tax=Maribacter sp. 2304DJ31-5 TaxID=3386273 RepID=UPI0039BC913E